MAEYDVLWFDVDDNDKDFIEKGNAMGLSIHRFASAEEGIKEFEDNPKKYMAVILETYIKEEKDSDSVSFDGFAEVAYRLYEKTHPFVYSGRLDDETKKHIGFTNFKNIPRYAKFIEEIELLEKVKWCCENDDEEKIKKKYKQVLEICEYIDNEKLLLKLVKQHNNNIDRKFEDDSLNDVRSIIEVLFRRLNEKNFIPSEVCWNDYKGKKQVAISPSSLFISQKYDGYDFLYVFEPIIGEALKITVQASQAGSHKGPYQDYLYSNMNVGFYYQGILSQLFEVLIYMKKLFEKYPNKEVNKKILYKKLKKSNLPTLNK